MCDLHLASDLDLHGPSHWGQVCHEESWDPDSAHWFALIYSWNFVSFMNWLLIVLTNTLLVSKIFGISSLDIWGYLAVFGEWMMNSSGSFLDQWVISSILSDFTWQSGKHMETAWKDIHELINLLSIMYWIYAKPTAHPHCTAKFLDLRRVR